MAVCINCRQMFRHTVAAIDQEFISWNCMKRRPEKSRIDSFDRGVAPVSDGNFVWEPPPVSSPWQQLKEGLCHRAHV